MPSTEPEIGEGSDLPPVQAQELIGAVSAAPLVASSMRLSSVVSTRASELSLGSEALVSPSSQVSGGSGLLARQLERARQLDTGGVKRPAESQADVQRSHVKPRGEGGSSKVSCAVRLFQEVMVDVENAHPLVRAFCEACLDRSDPSESQVLDHGTWNGRWELPSRSEWNVRQRLKLMWPTGSDENGSLAVQASRKEFRWSTMTDEQKVGFEKAAVEAWSVWTGNDAVEALSPQESDKTRARLKANNESCKISTPAMSSRTSTREWADRDLMAGREGQFAVVDARSQKGYSGKLLERRKVSTWANSAG